MRHIAFLFAGLLIVTSSLSHAQEAPGSWLIGKWEGSQGATAPVSEMIVFEFKQGTDGIVWTMSRKGELDGVRHWWEGAGVVSSVKGADVELDGTYTASSRPRVMGVAIKYMFTRSDDVLAGHFIGANARMIAISVTKQKK